MNKLRIEYTKKMEYSQSKAAGIIPVAPQIHDHSLFQEEYFVS